MVRYSFNRYKDGLSYSQVYKDLSTKFQINSHLRNFAARHANGIFKLNKDKKVYFGKFLKFKKGLKNSRDMGIMSEGEFNQKGNRLFKIDVENHKFIYKRACKEHYDLKIVEKLSNKRK